MHNEECYANIPARDRSCRVARRCGRARRQSGRIPQPFGAGAGQAAGIPGAAGCGDGGSLDQAFDAYAALRYLSQLDFVDPARVAVLGQSMGGLAVLNAVDRDLAAQYFNERFRAAIAYYPGCGIPSASMTAPTLVLIGEADDWTPAERCGGMVAHSRPDGAAITLIVYPGAYHAFDVAEL